MIEIIYSLAPTPRKEPEPDPNHSNPDERAMFGMILLIMSLSMLFLAGLIAHVWLKYAFAETNRVWKPIYFKEITLALIGSTSILVLSSFTFHLGFVQLAKKNNKSRSSFYTSLTLLLGFLFIGTQFYCWYLLSTYDLLVSGKKLFSFLFYFLTGLHIIHLLVGIFFQFRLVLLFNTQIENSKLLTKLKYQLIYWHFLDIIWIMLFLGLYLI